MKQLALLFLPFLLALTTTVHASEPAQIGYVDMQIVIDQSEMGKHAQEALKEEFGPRQKEFAKEEQSIRQLQQALARDQSLMSQSELDKKTAAIQKRVKELQKKAANAQQELAREQNKLGGEILRPTRDIIAKVAKDKQVSVVFERRQSGLLYIDESLDLTPEVIKGLDAQKKKKK